MKEAERRNAVVSLWLERPEQERVGILALQKFHVWLENNRPELLDRSAGDSYQHLKTVLRDHITWEQA
jgi:hypothetical protein